MVRKAPPSLKVKDARDCAHILEKERRRTGTLIEALRNNHFKKKFGKINLSFLSALVTLN